ncbi:nicotinate-nucleotide adenylyltransferase [uncultured Sphingomonas sp.]|uniref:nicotinate-nucleotide adenylyltransferase n=1 Tax=uncultured Sphingomonas sp. TaxID=158754 RepID=UPI0025E86A57|nr:nicotinate-nucleotide adenylyltransferase [uncultured Sphingomonas sp.]
MTARRIGLMGGSFNPAHGGHRYVAIQALRALDLDEVWWLVSPGNPLKEAAGDMAPYAARVASAKVVARHVPIRVSTVEATLGTRYTVDLLEKLPRLYPKKRFVWIMGADNLGGFHRWKRWRDIARAVPIAVVARPGYDGSALASPAMGWLRRTVRPAGQARRWDEWRLPGLVLLRFRPDRRSATGIRAADPAWHRRYLNDRRSPISSARA